MHYSNFLFASIIITLPITVWFFKYELTEIITKKPIPNNWFGFCVVYVILNVVTCPILAQIPNYLPAKLHKKLITRNIEQEFENIFQNYSVNKFDSKDLGNRPCDIENRFTYILVNINLIEETNKNIQNRYANLNERKKVYENNLDKVNKRAQIASETFLIDIPPNITETNIELEGPYNRMRLWAKEIEKNIENDKCNTTCSFNHIDASSIKIVEEISRIQREQDKINKQLTIYEKTFDKLELKQRTKENQLLAKGF